MAAEPNDPKTGNIAFYTVASLILILVSCIALEGLFYIWETRAANRSDLGGLPTPLEAYRHEVAEKLANIKKSEESVLRDAAAGKPLAIQTPAAPATPGKTPEKAAEKK